MTSQSTEREFSIRSTGVLSLLGVLCAAFLSGNAQANPLICTNGEMRRMIEVVYAEPGQPVPCEVIYDKSAEGSIESLWRADNEAGYCEARAAELADKLASMGWQCSRQNLSEGDSEPGAFPGG